MSPPPVSPLRTSFVLQFCNITVKYFFYPHQDGTDRAKSLGGKRNTMSVILRFCFYFPSHLLFFVSFALALFSSPPPLPLSRSSSCSTSCPCVCGSFAASVLLRHPTHIVAATHAGVLCHQLSLSRLSPSFCLPFNPSPPLSPSPLLHHPNAVLRRFHVPLAMLWPARRPGLSWPPATCWSRWITTTFTIRGTSPPW